MVNCFAFSHHFLGVGSSARHPEAKPSRTPVELQPSESSATDSAFSRYNHDDTSDDRNLSGNIRYVLVKKGLNKTQETFITHPD